MNRLRKNGPTLRLLQKAPAPLQKRILDKASSELIRCLCDCAHNVLQGNVNISLAPLLAVLPVTGKPGAYVSKRYDKIQYHPVLKKNLSDIHISLRDDQGKRIRFRKGIKIKTAQDQTSKVGGS